MYNDIVILDYIARLRAVEGESSLQIDFRCVPSVSGAGGEIWTRMIGIEMSD